MIVNKREYSREEEKISAEILTPQIWYDCFKQYFRLFFCVFIVLWRDFLSNHPTIGWRKNAVTS